MKTLEELQKEYNESKKKLDEATTAYRQATNEEENAYFALQKEEYRIRNKELDTKMASISVGTILVSKDGIFRTCPSDYDLIYITSIEKLDDTSFAYAHVHYYTFEKRGKGVSIKTYEDTYIDRVDCWMLNIPRASDRDIKLIKNYLIKYTKLLGE